MPHLPITRRDFLRSTGALAALGCVSQGTAPGVGSAPPSARLTARPKDVPHRLSAGTHRTDVEGTEAVFHLPAQALQARRVPLMLFLHGARRNVDPFMDAFRPLADETGVMVLMPLATNGTWDAIHGRFGPDVQGLDRVLTWVFDRVPVARAKVALSGFSDGATYSLALGRANGDLFRRVIAYSPGFLLPVDPMGTPPIVISHGTEDAVLSFERSRDVTAPALREAGYVVHFRSFTGPHVVPLAIAREQMRLLAAT